MMKPLSFKTTSNRLLLCVFLSLLRDATDSRTTTPSVQVGLTPPANAEEFHAVTQNETSITLEWTKVDNIPSFILKFNDREETVTAPEGQNRVRHTISGLTNATTYTFTLLTVFEGINSTGVSITASTAPPNAQGVQAVTQNETSITLEWTKVGNILSYILKFNNKEETVTAPEGQNPVRHTITGLTNATTYTFTLLTVLEGINSTGVSITASTAPANAEGFQAVTQNETSITLEWTKVFNILNYILKFNGREETVTAPEGQNRVRYTISGLTNATTYTFTLLTVFEGINSTGVSITASTAPPNAQGVQAVTQNETSITLEWTKVGNILSYILKFNNKEETVTAPEGQNPVRHTISGLTGGTTYTFTLLTVLEGINSAGVSITASTAPANAEEFHAVTQNETSITLEWTKVFNILNYILKFDNKEETVAAPEGQNPVRHTISGLTNATTYTFTLLTVFEGINSTGVNLNASTAPPNAQGFQAVTQNETSITLEWTKVGNILNYILNFNDREETEGQNPVRQNRVRRTISGLTSGTTYTFTLLTVFEGIISTGVSITASTAPPNAQGFQAVTQNETSITLEWTKVDNIPSYILKFNNKKETVVAPEGQNPVRHTISGLTSGTTYTFTLLTVLNNINSGVSITASTAPADVGLNAFCEYSNGSYSINVVWDKLEGEWTEVEVNVTGQTHKVFANGSEIKIPGFQPAKMYEVSIGLVSLDAGTVRRSAPYVFLCYTDPRGVIAGSVLGVLLFFVLIGLAAFILLKKNNLIRKKTADETSKAIPVAAFPDHFSKLSVDDRRGVREEYKSLASVGTKQTCKAATRPENKARNRFDNVLPYDWCRVKLSTSNPNETSDYINASYMPGYSGEREYIATQGPLPSTVSDFWRMIWEQRVKDIVMVTNCVEEGQTKCERYWPSGSNPCSHGNLVITMKSEQPQPNWTLREFTVKNTSMSEELTVKHFHFTAWPDHGVPEETDILIQFSALVRRHIDTEGDGAPTVVHCSAGEGRTGIIIALDVLLQQIDKKREVGINAVVHKMRLNRPYMVRSESQYVFLHQCIMDHLKQEDNIYENPENVYANTIEIYEIHQQKTNA